MNCRAARANLLFVLIAIWFAASGLLLAGCGSSSSNTIVIHHTPTPAPTSTTAPTLAPTSTPVPPTATPTPMPSATPTATPAPAVMTSSTGMVVDPATQLAYVPLLNSPDPDTGGSRIAILNTAVDPDVTNPSQGTIVLSHRDIISSIALDTADGLLIVTSGGIGNGGFVDLINESTRMPITGSPFAMPKGTDVYQFSTNAGYGEIWFDPVRKVVVISTLDDLVQNNCPSLGACTGFTTFDLTKFTFTPITQTQVTYGFSVDPSSNVVVPMAAFVVGAMGVIDLNTPQFCALADANLAAFPEGVSFDSTTHIAVIGNDDSTVTALNLFGSSLMSTAKAPCELVEGGTSPNSVKLEGLPGSTSASIVNPVTHQAFLIEEDFDPSNFNNGIVLMNLPPFQVTQLSAADLPEPQVSSLPFDPFGFYWQTESEPFQVTVDDVHNMAYATGIAGNFLAQIDLTAFQTDPAGIATPLTSATSCAGLLAGSFGCNNHHGLVFYPLPPAFGN
jgi:hypothetical protein